MPAGLANGFAPVLVRCGVPGFLLHVADVAKGRSAVRVPEDFFLRPRLDREKFPEERKLRIASEVETRIQAQDAAGHLVFTETIATAQPEP